MAEAQGFEPWVPCGTSVFKTGAISQTLPHFQNGAVRETRTPDLMITNQLLYQLSYNSIGWESRTRTYNLRYQKPVLYQLSYFPKMAQEQGLEPWTLGFGDRCSTN